MSVASAYDSCTAVRVNFPLHWLVNETTHPNGEGCFVSSCKDYGVRSLKHVSSPHERHRAIYHSSSGENAYGCPKRPKRVACILLGREQDIVDEANQRDVRNPELRHPEGDMSPNGLVFQAARKARHAGGRTLTPTLKCLFAPQAFAKQITSWGSQPVGRVAAFELKHHGPRLRQKTCGYVRPEEGL